MAKRFSWHFWFILVALGGLCHLPAYPQESSPAPSLVLHEVGFKGHGAIDEGVPFDYSLTPRLWFNRVDAAHLAATPRVEVDPRLTLYGMGGYKTGLRRATYGAGATFDLERTAFTAEYVYAVDPRYEARHYGRFLNSMQTLLAKPDYFDYYANERLRVGLERHAPALDAKAVLRLNIERHRSVDKMTDYDIRGRDGFRQPLNPPIAAGLLRSLSGEVTIGEESAWPLGLGGSRQLHVSIEHSSPDLLASDFSFTRFEGEANYFLDTFAGHRSEPMTLDLRLTAGTFTGTLPPQRYGIVEAALRPFSPFGVLRTLPDRPYVGSRHLAFFWEHNFRGVPLALLGLGPLAERGWELMLFGGHGRAWGEEAPPIARTPNGFHHEIGLSFNRVLGLFRIDLAKRLDAKGFAVSIGAARIF